jgi:hypothetical protein
MARPVQYRLAMKKSTSNKLTLRTQVIRQLTNDVLDRVAGGFIMKDTIIVKTSTRIAPVEDDR